MEDEVDESARGVPHAAQDAAEDAFERVQAVHIHVAALELAGAR